MHIGETLVTKNAIYSWCLENGFPTDVLEPRRISITWEELTPEKWAKLELFAEQHASSILEFVKRQSLQVFLNGM